MRLPVFRAAAAIALAGAVSQAAEVTLQGRAFTIPDGFELTVAATDAIVVDELVAALERGRGAAHLARP